MIKVLIADDHELVRTGLRRMLEDVAGIDVVAAVGSGEEALDYCRQSAPDVVLMDLHMPGIGGAEATRKILQQNSAVRVLAVTVCNDGPLPSRLMQLGAAGYLTKGAELKEMIDAIKAAAAGQRYLSPEIAQQLALRQFDGGCTPFDQLSDREMQIAMMIVNCQKVQTISDKLHLSPKTVNSYRYRIFEKLGISSDVELTVLAVRYKLLDEQGVG